MLNKICALGLSAALVLLSFGPEASRAAAEQLAAKPAQGAPLVLPEIPKITSLSQLNAGVPILQPGAVAGAANLPQIPEAAAIQDAATEPQVLGFAADLKNLAAPSAVAQLPENAGAGEAQQAAAQDFSEHVLGERLAPAAENIRAGADIAAVSAPAQLSRNSRISKPAARVSVPAVEARSPIFPAMVGGVFGAAAAALKAVATLVLPVSALAAGTAAVSISHAILLTAAAVLAVPAAVFLPRAAWEAAQYAYVTRRGKKVSDDDFRNFVQAEVLAGRLDGGLARLIRIYRPEKSSWSMGLGYHSAGAIALRPELAASPMVFRSVLAHEFKHYRELKARGPPKGFFAGLWRQVSSEVVARAVELNGSKNLKAAKIPALERAAREAQVSLNLDQPYEMLVVNARSPELKDAALYKNLSMGRAKVETLSSNAPQNVLGEPKNAGRYRAVVMETPDVLLPAAGTLEAKKLDLALKKLDGLYLLATRRMTSEGAFKGSSEMSRYRELVEISKTLSTGSKKDVKKLERMVKDFWHQIASTRLKGVGPADFIEKLYDGLQDKGMAFLSFGPTDPGVTVWERLLRYWEAADGGEFRTVRVDLEDGGHIMILRKVESRVGLWLKPRAGGTLETSVPDASATEERKRAARQAMAKAGFYDQLAAFEKLHAALSREMGRRGDVATLQSVGAAVRAAADAGAIADVKAFTEAWLKAGVIAEGRFGPETLKRFDALSQSYLKAKDEALKTELAELAKFVAELESGISAPVDIAALVPAARAEVEAAQSADSLRIFDETAAKLPAGDLKEIGDALAALRTSLERGGRRNYLSMLDSLGVEVKDVFGKDVGRQEIYVTVPRRNAAAIDRYVAGAGSAVIVARSRSTFETQLMDSAKIQDVAEIHKLGIRGEGAVVEEIDTGGKTAHEDYADRDDGIDMMHEGHEDWAGHRTHVGGIVASSNPSFLGMAPAVNSIGAKVFGRDTPGASDGDIMGAATVGLQRSVGPVDVINLSLGSKGSSSDNLARFFSDLTLKKNAAGDYVIVVASAGNAGPFDESISQPSAGENVISVAAASKSEDDGVPEMSFFSSVGPDRPMDSAIDWIEIKPDLTALGGDVTTDQGDPNSYKKGIFSAKSKDMPATPSDLKDKKHTGMSGTSMAAPMIAGIAALVKLALKAARAVRDFVYENLPLSVKAILMFTAKDMGVPVWFQGAGFVDAGAAVKLVLAGVSGSLRFRLAKLPGLRRLAPAAGADSWAWIERFKNVLEVGRTIRQTAEIAKTEARARFEDQPGDDEDAHEDKPAVGDKIYQEIVKKFAAAREEALPALLAALKDANWLVRRQAALILLNCRSSKTTQALLDAALNDADARVRQMAWLALAKNPSHAVDAEIKKAVEDSRWDVSMYAAYALAQHGDASAVAKISARTRFTDEKDNRKDKQNRFTAVWLLGQLGDKAGIDEGRALSAKLKDLNERGNIRHLSAAALYNLAQNAPAAIGDDALVEILEASGEQNLALTRTISRFFPAAVQDRRIVGIMKQEPVKSKATEFVLRNRAAVQRPGALGEMVSGIAKVLDIPLDVPTLLPDAGGLGVPGVDAALGPLDVIVEAPGGAPALDAKLLSRYSAAVAAALPVANAVWVKVPEHKLFAFSLEMRRLGYAAKLSRPYVTTSSAGGVKAPGTVLDLGASLPLLPDGADLSIVSINASRPVSEATVMAALEGVAARAADPLKTPALILLELAGPALKKDGKPAKGPLGELVNRLVLGNVQVVVSAGNGGPARDTLASPADASLAVVVAAAGEKTGLQFYSARGTAESPGVTWTELVAEADIAGLAKAVSDAALGLSSGPVPVFGTGAAARSAAVKLAALASKLAAAYKSQGRSAPDGFYLYLVDLVKQKLAAMPAQAIEEVGGGLNLDAGAAAASLDESLKDTAQIDKQAPALIAAARARGGLAVRASGLSFWDRMKDPYVRAAKAVVPRGLHAAAADLAEQAAALAAAGVKTPQAARAPPWWKDPTKTHKAVTVPVFSLRRERGDQGIGKFTDIAEFFKNELRPQGADTMLLLPHFAVLDESPYAPASLYALNEDYIDWGRAESGSSSVDYEAVRKLDAAAAAAAYQKLRGTPQERDFQEFAAANQAWLGEYAEFATLSKRIGKPVLDWTSAEVAAAQAAQGFADEKMTRVFAQWVAHKQLKAALDEVHGAGGRVLFDIPMFRAKNSVDAWKRPELFTDLKTRNPGIKNKWVNEDWLDLALWNWTRTRKDGFLAQLAPFAHWLDFGFDGGRVDALHFAYRFGNGQLASGDEPGEEYVKALGAVFAERGALPVAEAFEGKADDAAKNGFITLYGDWKKVSSADDPRQLGFLPRLFGALSDVFSGKNGRFVSYTLGDERGDSEPIKVVRDGRSYWRYRVPMPGDAAYGTRVRSDARAQLEAMKAMDDGGVWTDEAAVRKVLEEAADGFIKHAGGSTQIWAASQDWFLEEWGRDTFVSLPGLLLSTGRFEEARQVLKRFASFEKDGLIPNKINDDGRAEYNTVDAPLWFIAAVQKFGEATGNGDLARELAPVLSRIIARYRSGTGYERYGRFNAIKMDADGLIASPAQATWMDADPEGRDMPVTPRGGKAVEINALWYSSLRYVALLTGDRELDALADHVKRSFNDKFWFETEDNRKAWGGSGGALRDVIEGDPHGGAIRPNMLFAVSHGGDVLSPERQKAVVLAALRDLLTPYGPRTLSPRDSWYRAVYETWKPPLEKDQAYHQGTVWPWLMGAFLDALAVVRRSMGWSPDRIRGEALGLLEPLAEFLVSHAQGSLPEVFDGGAPDPNAARASLDDPKGLGGLFAGRPRAQNPGGTHSQAWSVAEVLRILSDRR